MTSRKFLCIIVALCCSWPANATRLPLELQAAAFVCGAPNGPCGKDIPAGVTCDKGKGWCQSGYYCGSSDSTMVGPSKCLEIPKDCGLPGKPCCPSNANSPHTSVDDKLKNQPFCKNGATCFFFEPTTDHPEINNGDIYAANTGAKACQVVPKNCGTGPGTPCCPYNYHIAFNPPLPRFGCLGENEFCDYSMATSKNPDQEPAYNAGNCRANEPGCGEIGKKCCVFTGGAASGIKCGAYPGSPGLKGYCADPPGWKGPGKPSQSQQVCTACPAKVDESLKDSNPDMYFRCKSM